MSYIPQPVRRARPDFSLTIINIVFLLLLFYLATGSLIGGKELDADAPVTEDLPLERLPRPLLLIAADGSLSLDGVALTAESLPAAAGEAAARSGHLNVLPQRSMPARELLAVLERLQTVDRPVRIVTLRAERPAVAGAGP